ncbi:MAG: beta-ketoacyl-ACP synthase III [Neisseria sp.]|nr:beta-ketoacyl-ACP synthase III [Neisseria sp.]
MIHSRILGTGSYLPTRRVTNDELAQTVDTSDEWIYSRTGIKARHIAAAGEQSSDLAVQAARAALEAAHVAASEIDLIIVATATPDMTFPATACIVQNKLGITNQCAAFDVQAVCAGFMYALVTAHQYIQSGMATKALVIGAEVFSRLLDWNDRRTCVLFGDGAGAVVLGASDEPGLLQAKLRADGAFAHILNTPGKVACGAVDASPFLYMDGQAVFKFAVKALAEIGHEVMQLADITADDIDCVVPHQANRRIIDATAKHLGISPEKIIITVAEHGNTSAASIPLALDTGVRDGRIKRGDTLLLEGIGGGFAWGALLLRY